VIILFKRARRTILLSAFLYAWVVRSFKPRPRDLIDPDWHREIPLRLAARSLCRSLPYLYDRYGERGVRSLQFIFYRVGQDRAPVMRESLDIDPYDARSLGRILDYEDGLVGVKGIWTEEGRGRAVKEERHCPAAVELSACPEVCTSLFMAMEAGTFSVLNPDLEVPEITSLLSRGDPCCLATIELPIPRREARKESPQATPGAFPPRLSAPGLREKLALQGVKSLIAAAYILLTDGPDQPMQWYERFRYEPGNCKARD
jgi:hypothetical protein